MVNVKDTSYNSLYKNKGQARIAFEQAVESFYIPLYRFASSLAKNEQTALDLTQQTYYLYAQKAYTIQDITKVKSWLFTTLYREFLRLKRRGNRMEDQDSETLEAIAPIVESKIVLIMDAKDALQALQKVDEIYRAPLTLFYLEDNSYQEIADMLDIPIGTVMSRIARGKVLLKNILSTPPPVV
jgi:RNA polymerase sigma-70 factor (ECF subfamily)